MGETPGHPLLIDAKAAEKVLEVLGKWLGINIKMGALDKRAKELEKFRLNLEKMMKKMKKEKGEPGTGEEAGTDEELKYIG
jgi:proteasome assembly chaperone (PAC2) family protein